MRDASFHLLDRAAWPRSEHFDYYIRTVKCRYDLTAHLTVTALRERGKALGLRFYPLLLYITARAINANREFRMGFNEHGAPGFGQGGHRRAAVAPQQRFGQRCKRVAFDIAGQRIAQRAVERAFSGGGELFRHNEDAVQPGLGTGLEFAPQAAGFSAAGGAEK